MEEIIIFATKFLLVFIGIFLLEFINPDYNSKIAERTTKKKRRIIHWIATLLIWLVVFI